MSDIDHALRNLRHLYEQMRVKGIDECIGILASRRAHYECYRTGDAMTTHPATFAVIDELLVFMQAHRERALASKETPK